VTNLHNIIFQKKRVPFENTRFSYLLKKIREEGGSVTMGDKQCVTFMQFCSMVNNFTKTSSQMLESIYQAVLLFHKMDAMDTEGRKEREQDLMDQIRVLRDSTATVLIEFKRSFSNASSLPATQQLVLNFSTSLIKLVIAFTNSARKLESGEEIGRLYKDILDTAKQTVSSINFSLKGIR
jgi:hypothetical protein